MKENAIFHVLSDSKKIRKWLHPFKLKQELET